MTGYACVVSKRRVARARRKKSIEAAAPRCVLRDVRRSALCPRPHCKVASRRDDESGALPPLAPLRRMSSVAQRGSHLRPGLSAVRAQVQVQERRLPLRPHGVGRTASGRSVPRAGVRGAQPRRASCLSLSPAARLALISARRRPRARGLARSSRTRREARRVAPHTRAGQPLRFAEPAGILPGQRPRRRRVASPAGHRTAARAPAAGIRPGR